MKVPDEFASLGNPISRHFVRLSTGLDALVIFLASMGVFGVVADVGFSRVRVAGATLSRDASQGILAASGILFLVVAAAIVAMTTKRTRSLLLVICERGFGTLRKSLSASKAELYPWNEIQQVSKLQDRCTVRRVDKTEEDLPASLPRYEGLVHVLSEAAQVGHLPQGAGDRLARASALQAIAFVAVIVLCLLAALHGLALLGAVAVAVAVTVVRSKHRIEKNVIVALWSIVATFLFLLSIVWLR